MLDITVHIQADDLLSAVALCGEGLHRVRIVGSDERRDGGCSMTLREAEMIDGRIKYKYEKGRFPNIAGPGVSFGSLPGGSHSILDFTWCEECFEHPARPRQPEKVRIHIRSRNAGHPDCLTTCGERIHSPDVIRNGKSRVAKDGNEGLVHVLYSLSEYGADKIEGLLPRRPRPWRIPLLKGPGTPTDIAVGQCDWCEDCFDHPRRALKRLARIDL